MTDPSITFTMYSLGIPTSSKVLSHTLMARVVSRARFKLTMGLQFDEKKGQIGQFSDLSSMACSNAWCDVAQNNTLLAPVFRTQNTHMKMCAYYSHTWKYMHLLLIISHILEHTLIIFFSNTSHKHSHDILSLHIQKCTLQMHMRHTYT